MKKTALFLSILCVALSSVAHASKRVSKSPGRVETYSLINSAEQAAIDIRGLAAKKIYNDMSDEFMSSFDGSDNNGIRTNVKIGENITCYESISQPKRASYQCTIHILNKSNGRIGRGAAS